MQLAELSQAILGDALLGLQGGNEPDLYAPYVTPLLPRSVRINSLSGIINVPHLTLRKCISTSSDN